MVVDASHYISLIGASLIPRVVSVPRKRGGRPRYFSAMQMQGAETQRHHEVELGV